MDYAFRIIADNGDPWGCPHDDTRIVFKLDALARTTYHDECVHCGKLGVALKHSDPRVLALGQNIPLTDMQLREAFNKWAGDVRTTKWNEDRPARKVEYQKYLQSPEWKEKRDLVMKRHFGRCQGCLKREAVDVHHLNYRHREQEFCFELVPLCRECHDRWHEIEPSEKLQGAAY